ncbi:hypothetical protein NPIL_240131 [Nephila pilipes]|uniref:Uncharacterized protein n=1 Tax=Nephila pilipes TaxID=299642 RepID=A0A8X6IJU4_NEPPI|nr:hypothetical protein NPIL_240131 [Nephila pilipes]
MNGQPVKLAISSAVRLFRMRHTGLYWGIVLVCVNARKRRPQRTCVSFLAFRDTNMPFPASPSFPSCFLGRHGLLNSLPIGVAFVMIRASPFTSATADRVRNVPAQSFCPKKEKESAHNLTTHSLLTVYDPSHTEPDPCITWSESPTFFFFILLFFFLLHPLSPIESREVLK